MNRIELETAIAAPVNRVFDLSRSIDLHVSSVADTQERAVAGRLAGLIELGETVTWEARHFCIRHRMTVKITELERPHRFVDAMASGPFKSMRHCHEFEARAGATLMWDVFEFEAPFGPLGRFVERWILEPHLRRLLLQRNAYLKQIAESEGWRSLLPA